MKLFVFYCFAITCTMAHAQFIPQDSVLTDQVNGFIENKGQIKDQNGGTNDNVHFLYSEGLFNLQLKRDGFSYELFEVVPDKRGINESGEQKKYADGETNFVEDYTQLRSHRIDVKVIGALSSVEITAKDSTGTSLNFYTSNTPENGITGVQSFRQVVYKNIYHGIDLVFTVPDEERGTCLKYEWIVHPGADCGKIKLKYTGARALFESADEGFELATTTGKIVESKVIAFLKDDHAPVAASYSFEGNTVSYNIKSDKSKTLVIDPNIVWSGFFGGNNDEESVWGDMVADSKNNVLIVGNTNSTQYIASSGAFQAAYGGGVWDAFLAKLKPNGKLSWATYFGSTSHDNGVQVATDPSDHIFLGGWTRSPSGISTAGAHQTVYGGVEDFFIAKFDASGVREWSTYLGGSLIDELYGLDCDKNGNLYVSGYTLSFNNISTPGSYQEIKVGVEGDAVIGKFSPGGTLLWCSFFGEVGIDRGHGIALGNNGDLFMQGTTSSTSQIATNGAYQSSYGGGEADAFLSKWDTNGNLLWCSYYGGDSDEHGRDAVTDQYGNAYIVGITSSKTNIATPGAHQTDWYDAYETDGERISDGYIAKFHPDGFLEWGTYYGGSNDDKVYAADYDRDNDVLYAIGRTLSPENISSPGSFNSHYAGPSDGFVVKFSADGTWDWGTYMGADGAEDGHGIALDGKGFLYLYISSRAGSAFSVTPGTYQTSSHGGLEAIVIKYNVSDACYDSYEPNNTLEAAKKIEEFSDPLLYGYTGSIDHSGDEDWFTIKNPNPTNLKIELTDLSADYDLKLYSPNGDLLSSSNNPGTADESIIYNNATKASYRLQIAHNAASNNPNVCYRFKVINSTSPWLLKSDELNQVSQDQLQLHIFPNPCDDQFNMKITSEKLEKMEVILYDLLHHPLMLFSVEKTEATQTVTVPLNGLSSGIYLLELVSNGEKITRMVAVQ